MSAHDQSNYDVSHSDVPVLPGRKLSEEEFVQWCRSDTRAEWVDGEVLMMSPGSMEHGELASWLLALLRIFVEQRDLGRIFTEVQVRLETSRSRRTPDVVFVSRHQLGRVKETHLEGPPDLAIEIVSPESEARDWREKYGEYEAAGVGEYWVIDPMSKHAEFYALSTGSEAKYERIAEEDGRIASRVFSGLHVQVDWLWPDTRPRVLDALKSAGLLE
jgi:Uma2 family endonuclease